jgi:maltose-binding protein MalE
MVPIRASEQISERKVISTMKRKLILAVSSVLMTWLLTSCGSSTTSTTPLAQPETPKPPITNPPSTPGPRIGDLSVETYNCAVSGPQEVYATLVLRNKSNKNVSNVKVQVTFKNALEQEVVQSFDFANTVIPDVTNVKGPNLVQAKVTWPNTWVLKTCGSKLENVVYTN